MIGVMDPVALTERIAEEIASPYHITSAVVSADHILLEVRDLTEIEPAQYSRSSRWNDAHQKAAPKGLVRAVQTALALAITALQRAA